MLMDPFLSIVLIKIKEKERQAGTGSLQVRKVEQKARGGVHRIYRQKGNLTPHTFIGWPDVGHHATHNGQTNTDLIPINFQHCHHHHQAV